MRRKDKLILELERFEKDLPNWAARLLRRARRPGAFWLRLPLAIGFFLGGTLGKIFVPGCGFWMLGPSFALFAIDMPFLRGPMIKVLAFINRKLMPWLAKWRRRFARAV